jgi:medium-chain acyl-[acyl-carrier-protein] hydrolase
MESSADFLVVQPRPNAAVRLFCFPHAGGGPGAFFSWPPRLGAEIECVCVQYPGRGQRVSEQPLTEVGELVRHIARRLASFTDKPYAFYGHSFGGLVAFELARWLRRNRMDCPQRLFVAASRPPHMLLAFAPIHQLPEDEFVEAVHTRYGGIPAPILEERDLLRLFVSAMRADFTAYELYRMQDEPPLSIPITAFAGAEDTAVTAPSVEEWRLHTDDDFELRALPGGHFFSPGGLSPLIGAIRDRLLIPPSAAVATLNANETTFR